jgi:hypothetical protein
MRVCQVAEGALAFAAGHPNPADARGVVEHGKRLRARISVLRGSGWA